MFYQVILLYFNILDILFFISKFETIYLTYFYVKFILKNQQHILQLWHQQRNIDEKSTRIKQTKNSR